MNSNHLFNLPCLAIYRVYDTLDETSRENLTVTCKWAKFFIPSLKNSDIHIKKIVNVIFENFEIIASSHTNDNLKEIFLFHKFWVFLGETHIFEEHRFLNGNFLRLIWKEGGVIIAEGGERSVEYSCNNQTSIFKWLPQELAENAESWDLADDSSCWDVLNISEMVNFTQNVVREIKELISLHGKNLSFKDFSEYFEKYYQNKPQEIAELLALKEKVFTEEEELKAKNMIYSVHIKRILNSVDSMASQCNENVSLLSGPRNSSLCLKAYKLFLQSKKNQVIAFGGSDHTRDPYIIAKAKELYKDFGIPFLFLIPLFPSIDLKAMESSLNRAFSNFNSGDEKTILIPVNKIDLEATFKKLPTENVNQVCKEYIINCQVETINSDIEHFGKWLNIVEKFLNTEIDRMKVVGLV